MTNFLVPLNRSQDPGATSHAVKHVDVLGVRVALLTVPELHAHIETFVRQSQKALVLHVNIQCLNLAYAQRWLFQFLNTADITFCDGAGILLGARFLGHRIPQRITYADWMWQLTEFAELHKLTLYFLGARPGVAEKAAQRLRERFPDLLIVGTQHGYFDKTPGSAENEGIIQAINEVKPNVLVVGFGMPAQERWLMENWDRVAANVALTGGAVFDYVSGELRRGPRWMTDHGLEWLARLVIEPRRLWQRYLIGIPLFLWRILKQRLRFPQVD
jgi:N-acetylglucosaminyldiphosphoundecaprenol N-acetyl-beta-D-mannosaminyltransferase